MFTDTGMNMAFGLDIIATVASCTSKFVHYTRSKKERNLVLEGKDSREPIITSKNNT